jgi:hypothetical protein
MGACEACSATWSLGTNSAFALGLRKTTGNLDRIGNSAFALGSRKTTGNLDRIGRSYVLPDAKRLLASSPAIKKRTPMSVYVSVLTDISFCVPTLDEHQTVVYNICEGNACLYAHTVQAYKHTCI